MQGMQLVDYVRLAQIDIFALLGEMTGGAIHDMVTAVTMLTVCFMLLVAIDLLWDVYGASRVASHKEEKSYQAYAQRRERAEGFAKRYRDEHS